MENWRMHNDSEFIILMNEIVLTMELNNIEYFPIQKENIKLIPDHPKKFQIVGIEGLKENQRTNYTEHEKLDALFIFMVGILLGRENAAETITDGIRSLDTIEEIKTLVLKCMDLKPLINLKFFMRKIKDYYSKIMDLKSQNQEDLSEIIFKKCDYCQCKNLIPVHQIVACECIFHVNCLEKYILEIITFKEFNEHPSVDIKCRGKEGMHMYGNDLKIISELNIESFRLKLPIRTLVQYYWGNQCDPPVNCTEIDNLDHFKVSKVNKNPEVYKNKCSYCGNKPHETCPLFLESLKYAD